MGSKRKPPKIFIISGPSGAGEDSVLASLKKTKLFNRVVTTITRSKRPGEREGLPYYFTTVEKFKKLIKFNRLIEWAIVYGDYRGCTKKEISRLLKFSKPILWKVDWQGVKTIKQLLPQTVAIFIAPPSYAVLEQRLKRRGQDSAQTIRARKKFSQDWFKHTDVYDYTVINEQGRLAQTITRVKTIVAQELQRRKNSKK